MPTATARVVEQHYWRVLGDQNHPATLLYLSGIAYQKGQFKSMLGQLNQLWEQEDQSLSSHLNHLVGVGRYLAATELGEDNTISEMTDWLSANGIDLGDAAGEDWRKQLTERLFGI